MTTATVLQVRYLVGLRFPVRELLVVSGLAGLVYGGGGLAARALARPSPRASR